MCLPGPAVHQPQRLTEAEVPPPTNSVASLRVCPLRPRLQEFVQGLADAGLHCRVERAAPRCRMLRRLRASRADWGADASFSLYFVNHADPVACHG